MSDHQQVNTNNIPTNSVVGDPAKLISTGPGESPFPESTIAPLSQLKELYADIKRNLDVNLEQADSLQRFNDLISVLSARHLSKASQSLPPASPDSEETKSPETQPSATNDQPACMQPDEKFIYQELIPGTASRLVKHSKTTNAKFTELVRDTINGLVDLLIVEFRQQTSTNYELIDSMKPIFDCVQPFYTLHYQKDLHALEKQKAAEEAAKIAKENEGKSAAATTQAVAEPKFNADEVEWRNSLAKDDFVDVVKHDLGFSVESWSKGQITDIYGSGDFNLGDETGQNVRKFNITYWKDASAGSKIFRADSDSIARFNTQTEGDTWRLGIQSGDEVDVLDSYHTWQTVTVIRKDESIENNPLPMVTVGFRRYNTDGDQTDEMGKYFGKKASYDLRVGMYSNRLQKPFSMANNNADPQSLVVWKFVPKHVDYTGPKNGANTGQSANKLQDEKDMAMITDDSQKIYATERYSCKSSVFASNLNKLGHAGFFSNLLTEIGEAETSLGSVYDMVSFFTKSNAIYHKQFVDDYYEKFSQTVETKLLSATSSQLRSIKLSKIEEIITMVWQNLLLRRVGYFDLQVLKSKLTVKIGILFMKQSFLEKRIDGAKMIEQVCQRALSEIGSQSTQTDSNGVKGASLIQELIDTLRQANVLDLFFSSKLIHEQLVIKSAGLLKLLLQKKALTDEELEVVWNNCQKNISTALELTKVLIQICNLSDAKYLAFFTDKISAKPLALVKSKEIELMLSMGRRTSISEELFHENQAKIIAFFWNYLFDDQEQQSYLDQASATIAINAFSELLRITKLELIIAYFQRLIENIKQGKRGYFSILIASKFLKFFITKEQVSKAQLVESIQKDYGLVDVLIKDLCDYMKVVKQEIISIQRQDQEANRTFEASQLGEKVFSDFFNHKTQLADRMEFIKEFAKMGKFQLKHACFSQIWESVITDNPIQSDHQQVSEWLKTIVDDYLLGRDTSSTSYEELTSFYKDTICAEANDFASLNLEGYHCIQGFFLLINLRANKLVVQDDDVTKANSGIKLDSWNNYKKIDPDQIQVCAKVAPNEMEGISVMWKIAIDCRDKFVGECVTKMLLQVHTQVDFGLEEKITMFEDQFVSSCLKIIQQQKDKIAARSDDQNYELKKSYDKIYKGVYNQSKINKILPVEEKRIIACLSYLKMLVLNSEKDGNHGLFPHSSLNMGTLLENITVNNAYQNMNSNGFRSRFTVQLYSNATIYQLKQVICQQLAYKQQADGSWQSEQVPHPWTIKIEKRQTNTTIKDSDNGKTLADMGFKSNEILQIFKKGTQSVSSMPLLTLDNQLNERATFLFTQIFDRFAIDDPEDPGTKVLDNAATTLYCQSATGAMQVDESVNFLMGYDSNSDGKLSLKDWLYFYKEACATKLATVRNNLASMGFRADLKPMPEPGSTDNCLQARKTYQEMPRFKIAQDKATFDYLIGLSSMQSEVAKEASSVIKMICTNQECFWNILKLAQRDQSDSPFSWDMIFNDDMKLTMYSLDIIDSIIKTPTPQVVSQETALRFNWVERFLKEGGFQQLLSQLQRALTLSKDHLAEENFASEAENISKKFIDQILRLIKLFIFAIIHSNRANTDQENDDDPLVLKRVVSQNKEKEEKLQRKAKQNEADEASFQSNTNDAKAKASTSSFVPPYMGPYANVGGNAYGQPVFGPQPPPSLNQGGAAYETTNVGDEDQKRNVPQNSHSGAAEKGSDKDANDDNSDEFEKSARFTQIVDQIRQAQLEKSLMESIDFKQLQSRLLEIISGFLSIRSNNSKEEGQIISSALSLWVASVILKNDLLKDFFAWQDQNSTEQVGQNKILNATDFILNGIYSSKSLFIRNSFKESLELICEKVSPIEGEQPLFFTIKVLMQNFPSPGAKIDTNKSAEFFTLFGALIKQFTDKIEQNPALIESVQLSIKDLLQESYTRLRDHDSTELDSSSMQDTTLVGLIELTKELLGCYIQSADYEDVVTFSQRNGMLHEFFYENLYYLPSLTTSINQNKCKSKKSRTEAYKLLYKLIVAFKPKEMADFLENYLWPMIEPLSRPKAWYHQPSDKQRSALHKYAGINNLGNICYMISTLQQLFMVPQFRYQIFRAIDKSPEDIQTYKERKVDDSLLRQFQRLFGFLDQSDRGYADPFDFCFAYKDITGAPTNIGEQQDSQEFLTFFFDRMEEVLKSTSQKYLCQDIFRGSFVQQTICQSCGKTKNGLTTGYTLSVEVENLTNLDSSIQKLVEGETIDDYKCDGCEQQVAVKRRQLLGDMPNVLFVHLQRILFDYNTFTNKKVINKFEFPMILDLSKYAFKEANVDAVGESDAETEELKKLMKTNNDDYVYRLVGVNIHRGVAGSGHYWSMINATRGQEEPDPEVDAQAWKASNEDSWKLFDDSSVEFYSLKDLQSDSFGGQSGLNSYEQDIASTSQGPWGKSAYMLVYERKLKRDIREVQIDESEASGKEVVKLVNYRSLEPQVPDWIKTMVQKDNVEFIIDRQVFNTQFFYLVKLTLKHISADLSMTQHNYPFEYIEYFNKMHSVALKIGHKVMFDFLSHYKENACLTHINDYLSTIFTFSDSWVSFVRKAEEPSIICQWIEKVLLEDQCTYFFHLMFNCPDPTSRLYCGRLVATVINKGFRILAVCSEKEDQVNHPKVAKLRQALDDFMTQVLDVIHTRDCQKNWSRLEQFYKMLEDICTGGLPQAEYLVQRSNCSIIVELCDLILQNKSPKAKNQDTRVEMGGSSNPAKFGPLVVILSNIVKCLHTETLGEVDASTYRTFEDPSDSTKPQKKVANRVTLSLEAMEFVTNTDFINTVMNDGYEVESFAKALAHLSFGNAKLTKAVCKISLNAISASGGPSDFNRVTNHLEVIKNQLSIDDMCHKSGKSLLKRRLEWIFGFPYLNTGLQQGDKHLIGLESLNHDIKGEVVNYKSMLTYDPDNNQSLLHLLWRCQGRMEQQVLSCLNVLAEILASSEVIMQFFAQLPGVSYQYARYSDWIQPFLMSLNNSVANAAYSNGSYSTYSSLDKEDIVKVMSKFEIYQSYLQKIDAETEPAEEVKQAEESAGNAIALAADEESTTKQNKMADSSVLKITPPAYVVCQSKDENYLNVMEFEGVMLSLSYMRCTYVASRPTGYTNLAVSAAFLAAKKPPTATVHMLPQNQPQANVSQEGQNKSASAMLAELDQQRAGESPNNDWYAQNGTAPLRVKQRSSDSAAGVAGSDPQDSHTVPKIIVDGNDEWSMINEDGYRQDDESKGALNQEEAKLEAPQDAAAGQETGPKVEMIDTKQGVANEEIQAETFDSWTGDEMLESEDLVYKFTLSNTTETPILYKISFEPSDEASVNLNWPTNGIKGSMGPSDNAVVALLAKVKPGEASEGGKFELEKLKVNLAWKLDQSKMARMDKGSANDISAVYAGVAGTSDPQNDQGGATAAFDGGLPDFAGSFSDEKNCSACTMLNSMSATSCTVCGTPF